MTWKPQSEDKRLARNEQERNRYRSMPEVQKATILKNRVLTKEQAHLKSIAAYFRKTKDMTPEVKAKYDKRRQRIIDNSSKHYFDEDLGYWLTASWFKG